MRELNISEINHISGGDSDLLLYAIGGAPLLIASYAIPYIAGAYVLGAAMITVGNAINYTTNVLLPAAINATVVAGAVTGTLYGGYQVAKYAYNAF